MLAFAKELMPSFQRICSLRQHLTHTNNIAKVGGHRLGAGAGVAGTLPRVLKVPRRDLPTIVESDIMAQID